MRLVRWIPAAAVIVALSPAPASADWLLTPYLGGVFGGDATFSDGDVEDEFERRVTFGASLGWMGAGIFGAELDFGHTPNFFEPGGDGVVIEFGDSSVTTVMGNVIAGIPIGGQSGGGVRPYAAAGVGLIRSRVGASSLFNELTTNDVGVNLGGGIIGFFGDNVGLRGDLRYFRSLQDDEPDGELDLGLGSFDFWRGTVGVTFRW